MRHLRAAVVRRAFPIGDIVHDGSTINGLPDSAVEEFKNNPNVRIVEMGNRYNEFTKNQYHFIAVIDNTFHLRGRICDAMEGCGYSMYAVIHGVDALDEKYVEEQAQIIRDVFAG